MDFIEDRELLDRLTDIVRANLRGDEHIIGACLYDVIDRTGYHEDIYVVAWRSESRESSRDCGTHRVCTNNIGCAALFSGCYDLNRKNVLENFQVRMENAPSLQESK